MNLSKENRYRPIEIVSNRIQDQMLKCAHVYVENAKTNNEVPSLKKGRTSMEEHFHTSLKGHSKTFIRGALEHASIAHESNTIGKFPSWRNEERVLAAHEGLKAAYFLMQRTPNYIREYGIEAIQYMIDLAAVSTDDLHNKAMYYARTLALKWHTQYKDAANTKPRVSQVPNGGPSAKQVHNII